MKKFKFIIDGNKYEVSVDEIEENVASVEVNGTPFTVEIEREKKVVANSARPAKPVTAATAPVAKGSNNIIKSPLPGSVMKVLVTAGQSVKRGDVLLTMESMKMENNILAETDGVIKNVFVEPGKNVLQDDKLVEIEVATTTATPAAKPQPITPAAPKAVSTPQPTAAPVIGGMKVKAPLPGSVLKIVATEGQNVKRGDILLTLESMKMENNILAEKDGIVKSIIVAAGQNVQQDDVLLILE
ncbi:MAG: biotin/lipoyl-binding protein [Paludibacteraceae bacterium]|jgi:glutaconyl-CoA/methylmalonyl-CoA decarboxylase subunit gamma|nr:biotin/lipoyl-binding protein [Paludibacteraceae bacterium]